MELLSGRASCNEDPYLRNCFWKEECAWKLLLHGFAFFLETPSCGLITGFVFQATPDLLKGQQELTQQTNEETAKQILYNYLKEGLVTFLQGAKSCPFWWGLNFLF